ncbi:hypothetical protein [Aminomonas paucivorans]|uniref:hypothetical protein n=1 Tax=Aminomonas paucivorans TaxID=81412 RepID=UPI0002FDBB14|nr:hypothetical protein [Aminomonas paucivorans]
MRQGKLFFEEMAYQQLDKGKDPLVTLAETVDWRIFEEPLRAFRESLRVTNSPAGRKPFDPLLMFKILVLQGTSTKPVSWAAFACNRRDAPPCRPCRGLSLPLEGFSQGSGATLAPQAHT